MSTSISQTDLSGMLGKIVTVRKLGGRTVVTNRPPRKMGKPTAKQEAVQRKFIAATQYSKRQLALPEIKALYASGITSRKKNAHVVAMNDYLRAPQVEGIDTLSYRGTVSDKILVNAFDDFMVTSVKIIILSAAGSILEEGDAIPHPNLNGQWEYQATVANPSLSGTKIRAVAYDRPGNTGIKEVVL